MYSVGELRTSKRCAYRAPVRLRRLRAGKSERGAALKMRPCAIADEASSQLCIGEGDSEREGLKPRMGPGGTGHVARFCVRGAYHGMVCAEGRLREGFDCLVKPGRSGRPRPPMLVTTAHGWPRPLMAGHSRSQQQGDVCPRCQQLL